MSPSGKRTSEQSSIHHHQTSEIERLEWRLTAGQNTPSRRPDQRFSVSEYLRWRESLPDLRNLSATEADIAFYEAHLGLCAICRWSAPSFTDHDHASGFVRGRLCGSCNYFAQALPPYEPPNRQKSARGKLVALYEQWPPAAVCGYRCIYNSRQPSAFRRILYAAHPRMGIAAFHDENRAIERMRRELTASGYSGSAERAGIEPAPATTDRASG